MAPILSFTAEEVWKHLPGAGKAESVFLTPFPEVKERVLDEALNERWERIWEVRTMVYEGPGGGSKGEDDRPFLDAQVHLYLPEKIYDFLQAVSGRSQIDLYRFLGYPSRRGKGDKEEKEMKVEVLRAEGEKCERCWNYDGRVGHHPEHQTLCPRCIEAIRG